MAKISIHDPDQAVNKAFAPYLLDISRFLLFWGGRDSSKSDFVAFKLLIACLSQKYFKFVLVRKIYDTVKESQYATIKAVSEREGLSQFFFFGTSPLEIRCLINGNKFICRGMDNPDKLKSIKDPTGAWYEEANQIEEADFDVLSTSLRTSHNVPIQEIFTFNPDHEGDYKKFWLYKKFFEQTGHPNDLTFSGTTSVTVKDKNKNDVVVHVPYKVMHSTYVDNRWAPLDRVARYESYKNTDAYRHKVWAQGLWATKKTGAEYYNKFRREKHVGKYPYLPEINIIHLSYDFNVLPYMTQIAAQAKRDEETNEIEIRFFREWCLRPPDNKSAAVVEAFTREFKDQYISVYYYGDASGKNRIPGKGDVRAFDDIEEGLLKGGFLHNNSDRVAKRNMGMLKRRDFINDLLEEIDYNVRIRIDESCVELINDLEVTKQDMYGKVKERINDTTLGVSYEKVGHTGDAFDYFLTEFFDYLLT